MEEATEGSQDETRRHELKKRSGHSLKSENTRVTFTNQCQLLITLNKFKSTLKVTNEVEENLHTK